MNILSVNTWFVTLIKQFFFSLDQVVFNFISEIYDLLIAIARTSILTQGDISAMAEKIYALLTVFMVFKVTLSLITYVVNPDDFADKSKGLSKLGTNIIISLSLLILTPYIFSYAFELQTIILEDNSLAKLIFATEGSNGNDSIINTAGDDIAFTAMSAFFTPNVSITELQSCVDLADEEGFNDDCKTSMLGVTDSINVENYVAGYENKSLGLMFRQDLAVAKTTGKEFVMEYKFIFSTVVGVVIILLLLTYCMDVAVRSIKLSFLQLIAPIPILSYVDPKSGKDGMFKKWYDMCFKTYLSLFIRLLALYFAIYIIGMVDSMVDIVDGSYVTDIKIKIFVIIGALMFAKQLPKMLEGLGIKLDGDGKFTLNPLKKFEEGALGGKNITGMARGALAGTAGMLTGAGVGAGLSGAWRGLTSGKGWKETGKATAEMNRKMRQAKLDGSSFRGRLGARFAGATGLMSQSENLASLKKREQDEIDEIDNKIKEVEEQQKRIKGSDAYVARTKQIKDKKALADSIKAMETRAKEEIQLGNSFVGKEYLKRKAEYESLKQNGVEYMGTDASGNRVRMTRIATANELAAAEERMNSYLNNQGMKDYMTGVINGTIDDKTFENMHENAKQAAVNAGTTLKTNGVDLHKQLGTTKGEIGQLERDGNDDQRTLTELDEQIAKYNKQKSPHNDKIRELNIQEAKAKANENAIK